MIVIKLKELLAERGLSQNKLSYRAEIPYSTVSRLMKSDQTRIDLHVLSRICKVLECQPGDLLIETDVKTTKKRT